jgi:endonuclease/exonuclease/phosphatase family metal-dependent hydrolase
MSWNIHGARGHNPMFNLDRVIALIKDHDPDVIALQEIDSRRPRERNALEPFQALKNALGTHGIDAKAITTIDGDYGQALISRWPIENSEIHDITYKEREPRRVIRCDVLSPGGTIRVIATHLGLSIRERRGQVRKLLTLVGEVQRLLLAILTTGSGSAQSERCWQRPYRRAAGREPFQLNSRCFASTGSIAGPARHSSVRQPTTALALCPIIFR